MAKALAERFDYSKLPDDTAGKLMCLAESGRRLTRVAMVKYIHDFGQELSEARKLLANHGNGTFGKWVQAEFDITPQTGRNYVNSFERCLQNGFANFETLSPTALYLATADSTPDEVIAKVKKLAAKQQSVGKCDVQAIIDASTPADTSAPVDTSDDSSEDTTRQGAAVASVTHDEEPPFDSKGEDDRTDAPGTKPQEPATRPPRNGTDKPGGLDDEPDEQFFLNTACANCGSNEFKDDDDGEGVYCVSCKHPVDESVDSQQSEQRQRETPAAKPKSKCPMCGGCGQVDAPEQDGKGFGAFWATILAAVGINSRLKSGKGEAEKSYKRAREKLKGKVADPPGYLNVRMHEYTISAHAKGDYCWKPATWLNQGHYEDEPEVWSDNGKAKTKSTVLTDEF